MTCVRLSLAALALAVSVAPASAAFVAIAPGPIDSDSTTIGAPTNGFFTATYTDPSTVFGTVNFSGTITTGGIGSWLSEARWRITNTATGTFVNYQPSTVGAVWPGTVPINPATSNALVWASTGNVFRFDAFESFNDPGGIDATWATATFTFDDAPVPVRLGSFSAAAPLTMDTLGSMFDTELALYTREGNLIAMDDDGAGGFLSLINAGTLPQRDYLLVAGAFNSTFGTGLAFPGGTGGPLSLQVNGVNFFTGANGNGAFQVFDFTVSTPAPAAVWMGLAGMGTLGMLRRRFRKA